MPYHQNPIDPFGHDKQSRVVHFPVDATMGHIRTPDASAPFPWTHGATSTDDHPILDNWPEPWKTHRWSRFPATPNIVFPSNVWNHVANVDGASPVGSWGDGAGQTFDIDSTVTSWVAEIWVWPSYTSETKTLALFHMGPFLSNWTPTSMDHYPHNATGDFIEVYLSIFQGAKTIKWIQHHGAPGNLISDGGVANSYRSKGDYGHSYTFDASQQLVDEQWNHIVLEWHYGGTEDDLAGLTASDWEDYWTNYDPTCRVFAGPAGSYPAEVPRGIKWSYAQRHSIPALIDDPVAEDYNLRDSTNPESGDSYTAYSSGGINYEASNRFPYGLLESQVSYLGGNTTSADYNKTTGWKATGAMWYGSGASYDGATGIVDYSGFTRADYNFKGYMTEFRLWKNIRYSYGGYYPNSPQTSHFLASGSLLGDWDLDNDFRRLTGDEDGLVAYYPMNEGTGDFLYDRSKMNNLPAVLRYTPKTTDPYPFDENELAANNVKWGTPPEGLNFTVDTDSVFIKQNNMKAFIAEDATNKVYASDTVNFGEMWDTVVEPGVTPFSFMGANQGITPPQVGDDLLVNWSVDPSCLKRDMIQTMSNVVTVAIPHYTEDFQDYLEINLGDGFAPDPPGDPDGGGKPEETFMSEMEIDGLLAGDSDDDYIYFQWDETNGATYEITKNTKTYWFDSDNKERFENIFDAYAVGSNNRISSVNFDAYQLILFVKWMDTVNAIGKWDMFHTANIASNIIEMRTRLTSNSMDNENEYTGPVDYSEIELNEITPTFSGDGTAGDPHILQIAFNSEYNKTNMLANITNAKLWVIRTRPSFDPDNATDSFVRKSVVRGSSPSTRSSFIRRQ